MRIGIVAGEASGDILGAGLIAAIKKQIPDAVIEGIAGPLMMKQGATSQYPMDKLSVMGIVEVLGHYRELSSIRKALLSHFIQNPPDVFIGIDAPDFNLGLEEGLRSKGIKTVHYVSPSVWAWRQYRIKKIVRSVDLMLTVFPFEEDFYQARQVNAKFVGHPLADSIELEIDVQNYRRQLALPLEGKIVALLPGSRASEVGYLSDDFVNAALLLYQNDDSLTFVAPMANEKRREQFELAVERLSEKIPLTIIDGQSRTVMAAADVVLLASGTATLEALLLKKPMVVAYRMAGLSFWIIKRLVKLSNYCLPNLLAGEKLIPELIQNDATPDALANAVSDFLYNEEKSEKLQQRFTDIHLSMKKNANEQAANAVIDLVKKNA